jgi:hypothetical protein
LQPIIDERIEALLNRFRGFQASGQPITLDYAFSAYTNGRCILCRILDSADRHYRHRSRICLCAV